MERKEGLSEEEENTFRKLFKRYEVKMDAEADAIATLNKNEFSTLKSFMHELVREKYVEIIELEMGLPRERWISLRGQKIADKYGKSLWELDVNDFKKIYEDMIEDAKRRVADERKH